MSTPIGTADVKKDIVAAFCKLPVVDSSEDIMAGNGVLCDKDGSKTMVTGYEAGLRLESESLYFSEVTNKALAKKTRFFGKRDHEPNAVYARRIIAEVFPRTRGENVEAYKARLELALSSVFTQDDAETLADYNNRLNRMISVDQLDSETNVAFLDRLCELERKLVGYVALKSRVLEDVDRSGVFQVKDDSEKWIEVPIPKDSAGKADFNAMIRRLVVENQKLSKKDQSDFAMFRHYRQTLISLFQALPQVLDTHQNIGEPKVDVAPSPVRGKDIFRLDAEGLSIELNWPDYILSLLDGATIEFFALSGHSKMILKATPEGFLIKNCSMDNIAIKLISCGKIIPTVKNIKIIQELSKAHDKINIAYLVLQRENDFVIDEDNSPEILLESLSKQLNILKGDIARSGVQKQKIFQVMCECQNVYGKAIELLKNALGLGIKKVHVGLLEHLTQSVYELREALLSALQSNTTEIATLTDKLDNKLIELKNVVSSIQVQLSAKTFTANKAMDLVEILPSLVDFFTDTKGNTFASKTVETVKNCLSKNKATTSEAMSRPDRAVFYSYVTDRSLRIYTAMQTKNYREASRLIETGRYSLLGNLFAAKKPLFASEVKSILGLSKGDLENTNKFLEMVADSTILNPSFSDETKKEYLKVFIATNDTGVNQWFELNKKQFSISAYSLIEEIVSKLIDNPEELSTDEVRILSNSKLLRLFGAVGSVEKVKEIFKSDIKRSALLNFSVFTPERVKEICNNLKNEYKDSQITDLPPTPKEIFIARENLQDAIGVFSKYEEKLSIRIIKIGPDLWNIIDSLENACIQLDKLLLKLGQSNLRISELRQCITSLKTELWLGGYSRMEDYSTSDSVSYRCNNRKKFADIVPTLKAAISNYGKDLPTIGSDSVAPTVNLSMDLIKAFDQKPHSVQPSKTPNKQGGVLHADEMLPSDVKELINSMSGIVSVHLMKAAIAKCKMHFEGNGKEFKNQSKILGLCHKFNEAKGNTAKKRIFADLQSEVKKYSTAVSKGEFIPTTAVTGADKKIGSQSAILDAMLKAEPSDTESVASEASVKPEISLKKAEQIAEGAKIVHDKLNKTPTQIPASRVFQNNGESSTEHSDKIISNTSSSPVLV